MGLDAAASGVRAAGTRVYSPPHIAPRPSSLWASDTAVPCRHEMVARNVSSGTPCRCAVPLPSLQFKELMGHLPRQMP
jgi:hypothetical protein